MHRHGFHAESVSGANAVGQLHPSLDDFNAAEYARERINRRQLLRLVSASTSLGILASTPTRAEAFPWALVARGAFSGAISWLVRRALDRMFPGDPEALRVVSRSTPRPTRDSFHNRFAESNAIGNDRYHVSPIRSVVTGNYLAVGSFVRCSPYRSLPEYSDLNTAEMVRSRDFNGHLAPIAPRRKASSSSKMAFANACRRYGLDSDELELDYVRDFVVTAVAKPVSIQAQFSKRSNAPKKVVGFGVHDRSGQCDLIVA
jgi:hypothetical protein